MINQRVECVWCSSKKEFNKFIRDIDRKSTKVIDHVSIKNKLMKADPYAKEPNDSIIGLTIMSEIKKFLLNDRFNLLIYQFKNLDETTVFNFINYIKDQSESTIEFSLVIIGQDDYPQSGVIEQFESINFLNND
jgi:hypothetical protein